MKKLESLPIPPGAEKYVRIVNGHLQIWIGKWILLECANARQQTIGCAILAELWEMEVEKQAEKARWLAEHPFSHDMKAYGIYCTAKTNANAWRSMLRSTHETR